MSLISKQLYYTRARESCIHFVIKMELQSKLWSQIIERSHIPEECLNEDVIVGIDEAGRGPVMGSTFYCIVI